MIVGTLTIILVMLWTVLDVATRNFGGGAASIHGTSEVVRYGIVLTAFTYAPYVVRKMANIRATVLVNRLPRRVQHAFTVTAYAIGSVMFFLIAYGSLEPAISALQTGELASAGTAVELPAWPLRFTIVLASLLAAIEFILAIWRVSRAPYRTEPPEDAEALVPPARTQTTAESGEKA